jgi:hypothetical protein
MTKSLAEREELWARRGLIEDILARSMDDWVHAAEFVSVAKRVCPVNVEGIRALTMGLVLEVLIDNLMIPGDVDSFGFHRWPVGREHPIVRIFQAWDPSDLYPTPGSVAWFEPTELGRAIGQRVRDREDL